MAALVAEGGHMQTGARGRAGVMLQHHPAIQLIAYQLVVPVVVRTIPILLSAARHPPPLGLSHTHTTPATFAGLFDVETVV